MLDLSEVGKRLSGAVGRIDIFDGSRLSMRIKETEAALNRILEERLDHWILTFSGGKDSTATTVVALEAALRRRDRVRRIDIIYSDTSVEIPSIRRFALRFLRSLHRVERLRGLPLHTHRTKPKRSDSFWVRILGHGYPPPHQRFRWCTRRLKIEPVERRLSSVIVPDRTVILTGVRFGESDQRDRALANSCSRGGECGQGFWFKRTDRLRMAYLAPLIHWRECDVWDFVNVIAPSLGYRTHALADLYNGPDTRFGCWSCTVVKQERALTRTVARAEWAHLKPLAQFRRHLWEATRSPGTRLLRPDGLPGKLRIATRRSLLGKLLRVQEQVGFELIDEREISTIKKLWADERRRKTV